MDNWPNLYRELSLAINQKMPEVLWIDLWHNQVNFLQEEHPFRTPAVFLGFRTLGTNDLGTRQQEVNLQVDFYLFYETFADTYSGAFNQDSALGFLDLMEKIHGTFHGTSGENYAAMRRVSFNPEDTGGAGNLYRITFTCILQDVSAVKYMEEVDAPNYELIKNIEEDTFIIPG